ncbi:MAG TPA: CRISPR-associated protein Cas5 [Candidatus Angelobacter sp.]|nr:CRISPR-associated protein Cas5 [Candidatus Angelobacter sp.]
MKSYTVQLEVAGPAAMWTRPDTGGAFTSYPAPTYSAAKGIFESIARLKSAYIRPTSVEICRPVQFHRYATNYRGPLRKANQLKIDASYQLIAVILVDVCYRLYGVVEEATPSPVSTNHLHALQEMFLRRLSKGQCFSVPALGWKEFTPSYWGPFRENTQVESTLELEIPSMLHSVFDKAVSGNVKPRFVQQARIEKGVLCYAQ